MKMHLTIFPMNMLSLKLSSYHNRVVLLLQMGTLCLVMLIPADMTILQCRCKVDPALVSEPQVLIALLCKTRQYAELTPA